MAEFKVRVRLDPRSRTVEINCEAESREALEKQIEQEDNPMFELLLSRRMADIADDCSYWVESINEKGAANGT